ncbi:MAG: DUF4150 domain-containing protein [Candidatus Electrothrix sp. EH2]|nr:DUF4150 domain-containing protein [Candidatus Electrothrix sp. EH2]
MANDVFANGREISCKKADGKSICAFPDVCMTPPENPATPPGVPVPYPNTGKAKDMTSGSKKVKISGKEIVLKNKSYFKKSYGDEAGSAAKKGVVTSVNRGKVYFIAWSMDVKVEGKNAVRHLDMTTHNHASPTTNTPPWPYCDSMAAGTGQDPCEKEKDEEKKACDGCKPNPEDGDEPCPKFEKPKFKEPDELRELYNIPRKKRTAANKSDINRLKKEYKASPEYEKFLKEKEEAFNKLHKDVEENECAKARRCKLSPYNEKKDGVKGCCPGQSPHHVIPKSSFYAESVSKKKKIDGVKKYSPNKAPCICLEGESNTVGNHGKAHTQHITICEKAGMKEGEKYPFDKHNSNCSKAAHKVAPHCSQGCIEHQVKEGHKKAGVNTNNNPEIKHSPSGSKAPAKKEK